MFPGMTAVQNSLRKHAALYSSHCELSARPPTAGKNVGGSSDGTILVRFRALAKDFLQRVCHGGHFMKAIELFATVYF